MLVAAVVLYYYVSTIGISMWYFYYEVKILPSFGLVASTAGSAMSNDVYGWNTGSHGILWMEPAGRTLVLLMVYRLEHWVLVSWCMTDD